MEVRVTVAGADAADQLRSLREWFGRAPELHGRVGAVESPPVPGPLLDAPAIVLAPGGVAAALAPTMLSWLKGRRSDVTVRITRPDGTSVELTATRVRGLDAAALRTLARWLTRELESHGRGAGNPGAAAGDSATATESATAAGTATAGDSATATDSATAGDSGSGTATGSATAIDSGASGSGARRPEGSAAP